MKSEIWLVITNHLNQKFENRFIGLKSFTVSKVIFLTLNDLDLENFGVGGLAFDDESLKTIILKIGSYLFENGTMLSFTVKKVTLSLK